MAQVVLRFIAGPQQGKEYPLEPDREIIIGRVPEVTLQIPDETVSRKHAVIFVREGAILLEDCSRNGTYVNGRRVKKAALQLRDQIQIGNTIIKVMEFVVVQSAAIRLQPITRVVPALETLLATAPAGAPVGRRTDVIHPDNTAPAPPLPTPRKPAPAGTTTTEHFRGSLGDVALVDVLQLLSGSRKSGMLILRTKYGTGRIFLDKGQICHARLGDTEARDPQKIFNRLLRWNEGTFELQPPDGEPYKTTLTGSTESLLLEAMHLLDEINNLGNVPPLDAYLVLASPLPGPLHDLSANDVDLIQLVLRHKTIQAILDSYTGTDFQAYIYLMSLLGRRFIVVANPE